MKPKLVIGDQHEPFTHPNYLQFCKDIAKKYHTKETIFIGDLTDLHAISRHQSESVAYGAQQEYEMTLAKVQQWTKAFPKAKFCIGNHDTIPERQAATLGMPPSFLKNYRELWNLPKKWEIGTEFIIDNVMYSHGTGSGSKDGALNKAVQERMSSVQGHAHAYAGIKYSANHRDLIFGMNVGCGIDVKAYAFAYGKHLTKRPILGCGVVFNSSNAIFVPMGEEYFRS